MERTVGSMTDEISLDDVYGVARDVPRNYVPRDPVDGLLVGSLTRQKHIVVFGSSKQGKTCLRKYNLKDDEYVVVTCSNKWSLAELHSAILKQAGYTIEQSTTRTVSGSNKIQATFSGKLKALVGEASAETVLARDMAATTAVNEIALELEPEDVNDIIRALKEIGFAGYIVLEDFHYLPEEAQRDFAVAMKAFHEASDYCFIVVGVWLDENRLIQHNGDLTGRVITVNADKWDEEQLAQVVHLGEQLLNFRFDETFLHGLVTGCFDSVYIVQEACYRACERAEVFNSTLGAARTIADGWDPQDFIKAVVDSESARYLSFIEGFAEGFVTTELEMYRYLLIPVLLAEPNQLEAGLLYSDIKRKLELVHPHGAGLNAGNITQALRSTASLQVGKLKIKPIVLDYDQSNRRLNVVDRGFLVWLPHQSRSELLRTAKHDPDALRALVAERDRGQTLFGF